MSSGRYAHVVKGYESILKNSGELSLPFSASEREELEDSLEYENGDTLKFIAGMFIARAIGAGSGKVMTDVKNKFGKTSFGKKLEEIVNNRA